MAEPIPIQSGSPQLFTRDREVGLDYFYFDNFSGQAASASFERTLNENPLPSYLRYTELREARFGALPVVSQGQVIREATAPDSPYVSAEEANNMVEGTDLHFDAPIPVRAVEIMLARKRREMERNFILNRRQGGAGSVTADLILGLAGSVIDPLNIAVSFIPVAGHARWAALAGRVGPGRARFARGAVEGAFGAVLVEPIVLGNARFEQADYTLIDSLMNVVFGTALGGGLHVGFGALSDRLARTSPATREATLRSAIAQEVQSRPVEIDPLVRADPGFSDPASPHYPRIQRETARVERSQGRLAETEAQTRQAEEALTGQRRALEASMTEREGLVKAIDRGDGELISRHLDDATGQRLSDIDTELSGTIPATRRATLVRERNLISEGIQDELLLARARGEAEIQGLDAAIVRERARVEAARINVATQQESFDAAVRAAAKADRRFAEAMEAGMSPEQIVTQRVNQHNGTRHEIRDQIGRDAHDEADYQAGRTVDPDERIYQENAEQDLDAVDNSIEGITDEITEIDEALDALAEQGDLTDADVAARLTAEEAEAEAALWTRASKSLAFCMAGRV